MSLLLKHDWSDASIPWEEDHLQMAIAQTFLRIEDERNDFTFAGDMNGLAAASKREASRAKLMGMRSGESDLRCYLSGGRLLLIEVKMLGRGVVSQKQRDRHVLLRRLGFDIEILWAATPDEAVEKAKSILMRRLEAVA